MFDGGVEDDCLKVVVVVVECVDECVVGVFGVVGFVVDVVWIVEEEVVIVL